MKRLGFVLGLTLGIACTRESSIEKTQSSRAPTLPSIPVPSSKKPHVDPHPSESTLASPTTLLSLDLPAYGHTLAMDEEAIFLMTRQAVFRITPGQTPSVIPLELGTGAALTTSNIVFWSKGNVQQVSKHGGVPSKVCRAPHEPQYFVTSGSQFAWLDQPEQGTFTIQTSVGRRPKLVYQSMGSIDAMTMLHDYVFFVERSPDGTFRFGGVSILGGRPAFTPARTGRTPAMLTARQELYFYDGNTRSVRSLSPDFQQEKALVSDFICSPIAIDRQIYCGRVEGLFEIDTASHTPRQLAQAGRFSITAIAANSKWLAWLSDIGPNQLALLSLPLDKTKNP
jgi:hypothetical protein